MVEHEREGVRGDDRASLSIDDVFGGVLVVGGKRQLLGFDDLPVAEAQDNNDQTKEEADKKLLYACLHNMYYIELASSHGRRGGQGYDFWRFHKPGFRDLGA